MDRRSLVEQAALGFLSHGTLSLFFTQNPLAIAGSCVWGLTFGASYPLLRNLPYKRYFHKATSACVIVHPRDLVFGLISAKSPEKWGYIRVQNLDKKELLKRLEGKRLDPATIPYHMRVKIERREHLDLPWEAVEPILRPL